MSYAEMTIYELEQERDRLSVELSCANDEQTIEMLDYEIALIEDELSMRDPLEED